MKNFILFFILCLSFPSYAQKNLLPIARAATKEGIAKKFVFAETQVQSRIEKELMRSTLSLPKNNLMNTSAVRFSDTQKQNTSDPVHQPLFTSFDSRLRAENQSVLTSIQQLWDQNPSFLKSGFMRRFCEPLEENSAFALQNNKIILLSSKNFFNKMEWLWARPYRGQKELASVSSERVVLELAQKLASKDLLFLGEVHFIPEIQVAVGQLIFALKNLNPTRRIVVFTEFVDLPAVTAKNPTKNLSSYYRRTGDFLTTKMDNQNAHALNTTDYASDLFEVLLEENFEIYPLEDRTLHDLIEKEQPILHSSETSLLAVTLRNKSWARVIETKMAEVRKTDPDALFVVYAGIAHTSWLMPYALPKFFANENTSVVEISAGGPPELNPLYDMWGSNHRFFRLPVQDTFFFWTGKDAEQLGKYTGFDYALILP